MKTNQTEKMEVSGDICSPPFSMLPNCLFTSAPHGLAPYLEQHLYEQEYSGPEKEVYQYLISEGITKEEARKIAKEIEDGL